MFSNVVELRLAEYCIELFLICYLTRLVKMNISYNFHSRISHINTCVTTYCYLYLSGAATVEERKLGCNLLWEYKCLERDDNNNTICIPWTKVKDGVSDCPNGTDEGE